MLSHLMYRFVVDVVLNPFAVLLVIAAVGVFNLWRRRLENVHRLLLPTIALFVLTVMSTPVVAYLALGSLEWDYPSLHDLPQETQAIVVLGGDLRFYDKMRPTVQLGESTLFRCLEGARLYATSHVRTIVVTGGVIHSGYPQYSLAKVMRDFLVSQGIPSKNIVMEERSLTTYENALYSTPLLQDREIQHVVVVTDGKHLKRAEACFAAQGFDVMPTGASYEASLDYWQISDFVPDPNAARLVCEVCHEWIGLLWYRLKRRI